MLGEFAGFKLEYRSTLADKVTLRGASEYVASVSPSPVGTISSMEHAARSVEDQVERTRQELARTKKDLGELFKLAGGVWEHEEHYRTLVKRQAELVDALDLTKNQAAAQLATESEETETIASATPAEEPSEEVGASAEKSEAIEAQGIATEAGNLAGDPAPELMTPKQFKAAGLGPANDAIVLAAARQHKPVSAASVDEYNLKHSLPKGYVRQGDCFVFKMPPGTPSRQATETKALVPTQCVPALLTPAEAREVAMFSTSGKDAWVRFPGRERWLSPGSKKKELAIERAHRSEITRAMEAGQPVCAAAVAAYKIKLPDGYEKDGDRFVSTRSPDSQTEVKAPSVSTTRASRHHSTQPKVAA